MHTSHWLAAVGFVAFASASAGAAPRARAGALSQSERGALLAGEVVSRPMRFETENGSYRGGVSYSVVHAPAAAVLSALSNVDTLPQALPHTKSARLIDARSGLARVELVHGDGTTYTIHIERSASHSTRFAIADG
ncbi:MAG TPA: SRPBCC family protein, partial [Polyangiaceae bacterium]|nr:SRPBCC family protein [Polyangiaceae bacterium]